ncbi:rod shape-determining protein MreC [Desulfofarcimen acetoxidans]|uniref:rod shape-determining protein MreC n=1 Tax=Desulfofarcimen acetoxidans TaxID=58138 RepID=UPI0005A6A106|nr:rod shape-determining protein MreC [Desulfofarcimen acetoxidans]
MRRLVSARNLVFLLILVGFTVFAMHITAPGRSNLTPIESMLKDTLAPLQKGILHLGTSARGWIVFPFKMAFYSRENKQLKEEVDKLKGQVRQIKEYELENERLRKLLDYENDNKLQGAAVVASIIARDPGNWFGTFTVSRGLADSVKVDCTVTSPAGLVGRVIAVSNHTAEVLLVTDPRSGVGCILQGSRTPGILEGVASGSGTLNLIHLPVAQDIKKGEVVITSGVGSIFPKDIPVGEVESFYKESSGLFKTAVIKPYVDFNRLEEVIILTGKVQFPEKLPAEGDNP